MPKNSPYPYFPKYLRSFRATFFLINDVTTMSDEIYRKSIIAEFSFDEFTIERRISECSVVFCKIDMH